jgi:predicted nucleic acid-binding protein
LEHPDRILLLDDAAARRVAFMAGCTVWGTLRVVLEAKSQGIIDDVSTIVDALAASGMWISEKVRQRILALAGE